MAVTAPARRGPAPAKSGARRPLFLIGITMSVLAFLLVLVLGSVVAGRATAGTAKTAVVVAAHDIHKRHVITAADLALSQLPVTAVPPAAVTQASQAVGRIAQVEVPQGQAVTTNLIATASATVGGAATADPAYLPIPTGWVALTIPASEQQAVAGYVTPGDAIDIQATVGESLFSATATSPRQFTRDVYRGVRVLKVGPASASSTQAAQGGASSLTVLMTPCDASYVIWLLANGAVRYTLRSDSDYGTPPAGPDPACPVGTVPVRVGPAEVDAKFGFTKG